MLTPLLALIPIALTLVVVVLAVAAAVNVRKEPGMAGLLALLALGFAALTACCVLSRFWS
jgi:hypothetical protein